MKVFFSTIALLVVCLHLYSQSVSEIKSTSIYLYGEGWGQTIKQADDAALQDLISKISIDVVSTFSSREEEQNTNGSINAISSYSSIINTYSQATLTNTQRIVIENEPNAHVLRYVNSSEVSRIFEGRKAKVFDMVESAERAERNAKIDDALRYYYWAFCLLKSLQYSNEVKYTSSDGTQRLLSTWIPEKMNEIFSNIRIVPMSKNGNEILLSIKYKDRPINSFDYTYFDGMDWSNIYSAKDGQGIIDLRPGQTYNNIQFKCEYEFIGESHIDRELVDVMAITGNNSFRNSYINVILDSKLPSMPSVGLNISQSTEHGSINYNDYAQVINDITKSISSSTYNVDKEFFSSNGWNQFQKLIRYGKAKVIDCSNIHFSVLGDKVICRGLTMSFAFKNNNKKFVENVVFTFNQQRKIDKVLFGLGKEAYNDIMLKEVWDMDSRLILTNFLEEYKTAYALKDLDFIKNVFDDNAVIITGRVTNRTKFAIERSNYLDSKIIKYNRYTKKEYLRHLEHCFAGNEYINIRFANNDIVKAGKGGETYGIQIKQDYFSSTYGDTGYLFIMVDINNPDSPVIKVRTWQPEKDPEFGVYGLPDF